MLSRKLHIDSGYFRLQRTYTNKLNIKKLKRDKIQQLGLNQSILIFFYLCTDLKGKQVFGDNALFLPGQDGGEIVLGREGTMGIHRTARWQRKALVEVLDEGG